MRLRTTRGVRKRYVEEPIALDDDDEPISVPDDQSKDDDFDAQAHGPHAPDEDNHEEDEEEGEPTSDDERGSADEEAEQAKGQPTQPKKQRNTGAGMVQSRKSFHDIPHYPLETRIVTRVYAGPLRRYARYSALRDAMYGPEYQRIRIIWDLEIRWTDFPVLPPMLPPEDPQGVTPSPWLPRGFERDHEKRGFLWYDALRINSPQAQLSRVLPVEEAQHFIPHAGGDIATLVGPWDQQKEFRLGKGGSLSLSPSGLPVGDPDSGDTTPSGWMFDVGGIPLAVAWAPLSRQDIQVLAVAAIPFSDQEQPQSGDANTETAAKTSGCIQLWEFAADKHAKRLASPSQRPPMFLGAHCFDWGRPKRLQFCPVSLDSSSSYGIMAVLCGDGRARVMDAKWADDSGIPFYKWIESPVVTLGLEDDYSVDVTCLTWVNTNRIALGHSDGSITLWSVYPRQLLHRVGVHTTYVIDICSAYPSNPYLIASIPVGGCATLTDLSQPSSEFTYFPVPAISFQPNLLCWNESMQGFMALYPSSTPNTTIAFLHHRFFCQARSICTGPNTLTCVSAGTTHPFILVGCADGSVFSCNALQKLFKQKGEPLRKLKIFEHEYRPIDSRSQVGGSNSGAPKLRGAARILQGFLPEVNDDPRTEKRKEMDRKKRAEKNKKKAGKRGPVLRGAETPRTGSKTARPNWKRGSRPEWLRMSH
ncbi:Transcription factor tau subunit sfc6 [Madurella mycetomatis]|uniref:Transcription factor tau subunit sfc6 n=1 Tax=Madurella mycetomatis TaxID=100816 RepID=A0A175VZK0_9PEZI|nr:Transcription factor tau subunit sfc6 [Madurella mycetomatis]